ncbi:MAG: transglycosylase SLT domain-containing protein [Syntrophales bacterium]
MPQIIFWKRYVEKKKKWLGISLMILALSVVVIGTLYRQAVADIKINLQGMIAMTGRLEQYGHYKTKEEIYKVLRNSGIELGDAMEVAEAVIEQSGKTNIPVTIFLAIMKKESNFSVAARSSVNAMGIMQIHPITWDAYAKKLNLQGSRKKAFDPSVNIMVSAAVLSDLLASYRKQGYREPLLWDYVLSAYYAGAGSVRGGLNENHRQYVKRVRKYVREMSETIDS